MPFTSKAQIRACFAKKSRNPRSSWNCDKWLKETHNPSKLPARKGKRKKA